MVMTEYENQQSHERDTKLKLFNDSHVLNCLLCVYMNGEF